MIQSALANYLIGFELESYLKRGYTAEPIDLTIEPGDISQVGAANSVFLLLADTGDVFITSSGGDAYAPSAGTTDFNDHIFHGQIIVQSYGDNKASRIQALELTKAS